MLVRLLVAVIILMLIRDAAHEFGAAKLNFLCRAIFFISVDVDARELWLFQQLLLSLTALRCMIGLQSAEVLLRAVLAEDHRLSLRTIPLEEVSLDQVTESDDRPIWHSE